MEKHPIEGIMTTTMENIRDMVDVNTVIGEAVETPDGSTVIPISKVSFGFVSGGGEYRSTPRPVKTAEDNGDYPFAGGGGAGVTVQPVGFLVLNADGVRMLPAHYCAPLDRALEMLPQVMTALKTALTQWSEKKTPPPPPPEG